ncbi:hypothetical protein [Allobaculum stercoricanis]|uniref:hypothetical protein n=1 Tax=Allobaculum stercoricanis TaxID=174709 RepID=UPI002943A1AF|nr:hypothetical protein [Allobaculum stercoricanis]
MNKKRMNVMLGSLTALCMACTTMSNAIVFAQDNTFEVINENTKETAKPDWDSDESTGKTVFYNGKYFTTLKEALTAAYMHGIATTPETPKVIHCKPDANIGTLSHGHVADDLIIYGNGAYVENGGDEDLEIDTWKYSRKTGAQDATNGEYLEKDITVTVNDLNGIAAWGQRHTAHKITLNFNNCKNMNRIYFTGMTGEIDINLKECSFDSDSELKSHKDTSVYSNANGTINIENCQFNNIDVPLNLNHKMSGTQTINIKNSTFTNCAQGTDSYDSKTGKYTGNKTYAAPIRVVAIQGANSNLSVENCEFTYSNGVSSCNKDILIGDGRPDAADEQGTVNLSMSNTKADVIAQRKGYHVTNNIGKPESVKDSEATITEVSKNHVVQNQTVSVGNKIPTSSVPSSGSGGATVKLNPVYRAYNPNNGEHLYTVDEKEYKHVASVGWDAEGVAFMAEEEKNGQALYRVYNPNSGLHHYTLDEKEKNTLVSFGWHDEKVAWYTSKKTQSAPVFRVYNPNDGNHHYTMNKQEKDFLVSFGWQDEGLAFRTAPIEK